MNMHTMELLGYNVDRSYWQAMSYIHHGQEARHVCVHEYWKYEINV